MPESPATNVPTSTSRWYQRVPDPMVLIFSILVVAALMTHVVPAGEFERQQVNGVTRIVPGSFHAVDGHPANPLDVFVAVPRGMVEAAQFLFIVFIAGGLFHLLTLTGALENAVGTTVRKVGLRNRHIVITLTTFVFGFFGAAVGFENNIALVPIGALVGHALGGGSLLGAGMAVGGIGIGFALSPINPYTVGVAQGIAELPTFSGAWLRTALLLTSLALLSAFLVRRAGSAAAKGRAAKERAAKDGAASESAADDGAEADSAPGLSKPLEDYSLRREDAIVLGIFAAGMAFMLFGVFRYGWYINEIAGVFLAIAVTIGIARRMGGTAFAASMMQGASAVTPGALVIGLAAAIKVILDDGRIIDTMVHGLSSFLGDLPILLAAVLMTLVQGVINFFIPGGSGQALVTMPIMVPLGDLIGVTRQVTVLAFQVGDGLTNLIVPTSGGTLAMLALARVDYATWVRFIVPLVALVYGISWLFIVVAVLIGYQ